MTDTSKKKKIDDKYNVLWRGGGGRFFEQFYLFIYFFCLQVLFTVLEIRINSTFFQT